MDHKTVRPAEAVQSIADIVKTMQALPVLDPRPMNQVLYGDAGLPEVMRGIEEADDPATQWVSNESVMNQSRERRAAWRKLAQTPGEDESK